MKKITPNLDYKWSIFRVENQEIERLSDHEIGKNNQENFLEFEYEPYSKLDYHMTDIDTMALTDKLSHYSDPNLNEKFLPHAVGPAAHEVRGAIVPIVDINESRDLRPKFDFHSMAISLVCAPGLKARPSA